MQERTLQFVSTPLDKGAPATGAGANPFVAASPATKAGFTLIEMVVVVGIIALLIVFGIPALHTMVNSFQSDGGTRAMIDSALSCARAIAVKEQKYAGIRFQYAYNVNNPDNGILDMPQYMIFIINDADATNLEAGFRAIEGMELIKLPESVGVMDLRIRTNLGDETDPSDQPVAPNDNRINDPAELRDSTTFSVVFSPSGKLIIHDVRTRNKNGVNRPITATQSADEIFNSPTNIIGGTGMFAQDSWANLGLGQEMSRNSFIIYDANILKRTDTNYRWRDYLSTLPVVYVNPYTGTIINNR
jgi:prepilin-type N-terminal cleavage/methylation domain-containing protein